MPAAEPGPPCPEPSQTLRPRLWALTGGISALGQSFHPPRTCCSGPFHVPPCLCPHVWVCVPPSLLILKHLNSHSYVPVYTPKFSQGRLLTLPTPWAHEVS